MHASKDLTQKLHKVVMTAARAAIGNYCFKKLTSYILEKCKWLNIKNMILHSSLKVLHKIITCKEPDAIVNLYKNINTKRAVVNAIPKYKPKSKYYKIFFIYQTLNIYYNLPKSIRDSTVSMFKTLTKDYLAKNDVYDTFD